MSYYEAIEELEQDIKELKSSITQQATENARLREELSEVRASEVKALEQSITKNGTIIRLREELAAAPKPAQAEKQEPVKDAPAYTFHIDETGKAYLKGFCVSKDGDPLYARPQPDLTAEVEKLRAGLENCRLFAARHRKEDWALLILGFCAEAGVVGSVTR